MWPEGEPIRRFDWREGSIVVPPARWLHQHFNTGSTPARYLTLRWGSHKNPHPLGRTGTTIASMEALKPEAIKPSMQMKTRTYAPCSSKSWPKKGLHAHE
jgi:hypothetical protein